MDDRRIGERFRFGVSPCPLTGCWWWTRSANRQGYGKLKWGAAGEITAHRISWVLHHGPIATGLHVLHRCDQPACVNPDHLFLGTATDNNRDRERKGRGDHEARPIETRPYGNRNGSRLYPERLCRGEEVNTAKLTTDEVRAIRLLAAAGGLRQSDIARRFGVTQPMVSSIVRRASWRHVE